MKSTFLKALVFLSVTLVSLPLNSRVDKIAVQPMEKRPLKELKEFIKFCKTSFDPSTYFQSDTVCIECTKKDFKKFQFQRCESYGNKYDLSFMKTYRRSLDFVSIYLSLNKTEKNSSCLSFYSHSINSKFTLSDFTKLLGKPIGYNFDSTSVFWTENSKGFFEMTFNDGTLRFYTSQYKETHHDNNTDSQVTIGIIEKIVFDSLPKLPVFSSFINQLSTNKYFFEDNIFSDEHKKVFNINFLKFCNVEFDSIINQFADHRREMHKFDATMDSLQNECFKRAKLYRSSSIRVHIRNNTEQKRINYLDYSILCTRRQYDIDQPNKKERIMNTLIYLVENSNTRGIIKNYEKIIEDFVFNMNIDENSSRTFAEGNFSITINYNKIWFNIAISMPKAYILGDRFNQ